MINKIKNTFTDNQQQLFLIQKKILQEKGDGKRILEIFFVIDIDFKVSKTATEFAKLEQIN